MSVIDEYIESQDPSRQAPLQKIRDTLRKTLPQAEERISYKMPTYWKGRNLIHFAAFKNHIGIYPGGEATEVFAEKLKGYKTSKGTIQIPYDEELPIDLIAEIAAFCYERYAKK